MLLVDKVPLDMADRHNPYVKEFREWKDNFLKQGWKFPLRIRTHLTPQINITGDREPERFRFVPWEANASYNGMPVVWNYKKNASDMKTKGEMIGSVMVISQNDMDKAFFYLTKCPLFKSGLMWLENKKAEAEAKLNVRGQMVDAEWLLLSENSPLHGKEDEVRTLALALHVKGAEDKVNISLPEVKDAMLRAIEHGEAEKNPLVNIGIFRELVDMPNKVRNRAVIQRAVDCSQLEFDANQFKAMLNIEGEWRELARIDVNEWRRKEEVLIEMLQRDKDKELTFAQVTGEGVGGIQVNTFEDMKALTFNDIKQKCNEVGIPVVGKGRTREVLEKELSEHLSLL